MKYGIGILLISCIMMASCGGSSATPDPASQGDLIMYEVREQGGAKPSPVTELIVADSNGNESKRIPLPYGPQVGHLVPVDNNYGTLFTNQYTDTDEEYFVYLIDVAQGKVLDVGEEIHLERQDASSFPRLSYDNAQSHWGLLDNFGRGLAYLVNLDDAHAYDLTILCGELERPWGRFSSDGAYLVIGKPWWLIPTANHAAARFLGTRLDFDFGGFSSDSKHMVYTKQSSDGHDEVVVERLDTSEAEVVATGESLHAVFVPDQNQLVICRTGVVSLLSLDTQSEQEIGEYEGRRSMLWFSPSGEKLLLRADNLWYLFDLTNHNVNSLQELDGYYIISDLNYDNRWIVFSDNEEQIFKSLDLESGEIHNTLTLGEKDNFSQWCASSESGKCGLVNSSHVGSEYNIIFQLWLLNNDKGTSSLIVEGSYGYLTGDISADGNRIAVSLFQTEDGIDEQSILLMDADGGNQTVINDASGAVWIGP